MSQAMIQNFQVVCLLNSADTMGPKFPDASKHFLMFLSALNPCIRQVPVNFFEKEKHICAKSWEWIMSEAEAIVSLAWLLQLTYFRRKKMSRVQNADFAIVYACLYSYL